MGDPRRAGSGHLRDRAAQAGQQGGEPIADDVLAAERHGSGPRLVLVHGFTQTRRSWMPLLPRLVASYEVLAVDAPGHGESTHDTAGLVEGAGLLAATGGPATYVGYSMGGRLSLHVALHHPGVVERLVLIGATAGIDNEGERAERRAADEALAEHLEDVGIDVFLDEWLRLPLFAGLSADSADVSDRRRNRVEGLAASLRHAGTGAQVPLWDRLGDVDCPALLVVGERDDKFRATAERMASLLPDATVVSVEDAGHSAHLEQPERTAAALLSWLEGHPPRARPTVSVNP